ncbi:hybrid sensor histidine kinase/response regulator transcription factor [Zobellia uliginosa]|uniref:hybrid sensor histidine kinase/response regulator transcription factor n=1 Tax=Zobellia uliginosa TaxID=143224 RepID=UPI0026E1433B|nr:two-component regulator propeller domain-containing protein [Zobellia uliginosa]MDO6519002.1 two-component regulator propeller domain-containing protein [Zobellia uliginosa]
MGLFLVLNNLPVTAQNRSTDPAKHYTTKDGLSHNGVTSILEDSSGFLWIGTYEGLSLYDGYEYVTIKNTNQSKPLANNRVRSLFEDKRKNIWIGTDEGISVYDTSKEVFNNLEIGPFTEKNGKPVVLHITTSTSGQILCATENHGILIYNDDYSFMGAYTLPVLPKSRPRIIYDGIRLDPYNYLYATSIGLFTFNLNRKTFDRVLKGHIYASNTVEQIDKNTLLATFPYGGMAFIQLDRHDNSYSFKLIKQSFPQYIFKSCMADNSNNLWLGTLDKGFIRLNNVSDIKNNSIYDISYFEFGTNNIKTSCFYQTSVGDCWLGTFNKGLYQFKIGNNPFQTYNSSMADPLGFRSDNITNMSILNKNNIYISSDQGGLSLFNTETKKFEPTNFRLNQQEKINSGNVFYDSRKNLWLKIKGIGLCRIKAGSKKYEIVKTDKKDLPAYTHISSYTEDKQGNIWVIGMTGVYKLVLNTNNDITNIEALNENPFFKKNQLKHVRFIYTDPLDNNIWLGTHKKGLFKVNSLIPLEKTEIHQYKHEANNEKSLPVDFVSSVIRLPNNELWVGTEGGGICKMTNIDSNPQFSCFTEEQGLSNNVIKSILYDKDQNLWVATNIGLNKLNTTNYTIRNFHSSDGLPFEDFWYSSALLNNGYMVFSGLNGICYFKPEEIPNDEPLPKFTFGNFKLLNKTIKAGDSINGRVLLNKRLSQTETIVLKHDENVFSLELTSLHFKNPLNHTIKYRLFPLNKEWVQVPSDQKIISYSGLQPGNYQLQGMASNSINEWTDPKKINIIITPPFWKTKLAYGTYIFLILIFGFIVNRTLLKIQKLNHKVEIEQLKINNVKEVNEAKLRFFSNISHEIKTPLTLIEGPTNALLEEFNKNPELTDKLSLIKRQLKKIYELIEQVQDFGRADSNLLKMNYSRFDFKTFLEEITEDFKFMAINDKKNFDIVGDDSSIIVVADRDKLEKILNNLINNAFKYSQTNDNIKIEYKSEDKNLIVAVIDTGIGIDNVDLEHIFERFYQTHKKQNSHPGGSGIGLAFSKRLVEMHYGYIEAESELGKGTKITFKLPIVKKTSKKNRLEVKQVELPKEKEVLISDEIIKNNTPLHVDVTGEFKDALIFYVEDNLEMRTYVSKLLSQYFQVKSFRNGRECIDTIEEQWPDIVISDIQMPEMNGLDLCLKIKSNLQTSHIPVILLTALTNIKDHLRGIKDGADAYIKKPFDPKRLITTTEALLINRKRLSERYQIGIPLTKDNKNSRNDNAFLDKLYSLMEENVDNQNLDLNSLAKKLYLNRTHFFQKVKVLTDQTPYELLKSYRLQKAAHLLVHEKLSVQETYQLTGFKSSSHFSKLFKEKYGVPPGKYYRTKRQANIT